MHIFKLVAFSVVEYVPDGHKVHSSIEAARSLFEYFPAGQYVHTSIDEAPTTSEYVPVAHD